MHETIFCFQEIFLVCMIRGFLCKGHFSGSVLSWRGHTGFSYNIRSTLKCVFSPLLFWDRNSLFFPQTLATDPEFSDLFSVFPHKPISVFPLLDSFSGLHQIQIPDARLQSRKRTSGRLPEGTSHLTLHHAPCNIWTEPTISQGISPGTQIKVWCVAL